MDAPILKTTRTSLYHSQKFRTAWFFFLNPTSLPHRVRSGGLLLQRWGQGRRRAVDRGEPRGQFLHRQSRGAPLTPEWSVCLTWISVECALENWGYIFPFERVYQEVSGTPEQWKKCFASLTVLYRGRWAFFFKLPCTVFVRSRPLTCCFFFLLSTEMLVFYFRNLKIVV